MPMSSKDPIQHKNCPAIDDTTHPVMLAYPNDCRKYYSCLNGFAYVQMCPDNLFWSQITYRCDHIGVANCGVEVERPEPTKQVPSGTYYSAYPGDCKRFYETRELYCPSNYYWNEKQQRCDLPELAECHWLPVPSETHTPVTELPTIVPTAAVPPNNGTTPIDNSSLEQQCRVIGKGYLPYPGDCHKFIVCTTRPMVLTCPANLFWNPGLVSCDTVPINC